MTQSVDIGLRTAPGARAASPTASADSPAVPDYALPELPIVDLRVKPQRSLWGNAWRQFRRHKLAMAGLVLFTFMLLATFIGSPLYPQEIDTIDFTVSGAGISAARSPAGRRRSRWCRS